MTTCGCSGKAHSLWNPLLAEYVTSRRPNLSVNPQTVGSLKRPHGLFCKDPELSISVPGVKPEILQSLLHPDHLLAPAA